MVSRTAPTSTMTPAESPLCSIGSIESSLDFSDGIGTDLVNSAFHLTSRARHADRFVYLK